jgi:hypothetical protein
MAPLIGSENPTISAVIAVAVLKFILNTSITQKVMHPSAKRVPRQT